VRLAAQTLRAWQRPLDEAAPNALVELAPAEQNFPVPVVVLHGLLAATTLVLVFLTAVGVGGAS
jgi:hypothetical protein